MFASRAFPTLGVLQATEVTGAPWGEEKSRLENCMRRAVGVAGSLGTPAESEDTQNSTDFKSLRLRQDSLWLSSLDNGLNKSTVLYKNNQTNT